MGVWYPDPPCGECMDERILASPEMAAAVAADCFSGR